MKKSDVKFASTKHEGLPEKKKMNEETCPICGCDPCHWKVASPKRVMVSLPRTKVILSATGLKVVVGNRLVVNMMVSPVRNNLVKRLNHIVVMQTTVLL